MKGILEKSERAKNAFRLIAHKTKVETSREYIAMGAVMKFFEELPKELGSNEQSPSLSALEKKLSELNTAFEFERTELKEANDGLNKKLMVAAKRIKTLTEQNNNLGKKLDVKIEQEFSDTLDIDDEFVFDMATEFEEV